MSRYCTAETRRGSMLLRCDRENQSDRAHHVHHDPTWMVEWRDDGKVSEPRKRKAPPVLIPQDTLDLGPR
jgi:hypothetical protein